MLVELDLYQVKWDSCYFKAKQSNPIQTIVTIKFNPIIVLSTLYPN